MSDIWRLRNPKTKRYTFTQNSKKGFIQRRLDYFFISNSLQENVKKTDIIAAFSTDHSPITFSLEFQEEESRGKGLWKFNNSLLQNNEFKFKMKDHISKTIEKMNTEKYVG